MNLSIGVNQKQIKAQNNLPKLFQPDAKYRSRKLYIVMIINDSLKSFLGSSVNNGVSSWCEKRMRLFTFDLLRKALNIANH